MGDAAPRRSTSRSNKIVTDRRSESAQEVRQETDRTLQELRDAYTAESAKWTLVGPELTRWVNLGKLLGKPDDVVAASSASSAAPVPAVQPPLYGASAASSASSAALVLPTSVF